MPARFEIPELVTFDQVFFSPGARGDALRADAEAGIARAARGPRARRGRRPHAAARDLRERAARAGRGAVRRRARRSRVHAAARRLDGAVSSRTSACTPCGCARAREPRLPPFDEIREQVATEFAAERRRERNEAEYQRMRARYDVVDRAPPQAALRRRETHRARRIARAAPRNELARIALRGRAARGARARASLEPRVLRPHRDGARRLRRAVEGVDLGRPRGGARAEGAGRLHAHRRTCAPTSSTTTCVSSTATMACPGGIGGRDVRDGRARADADGRAAARRLSRRHVDERAAHAGRAERRDPGAAELARGDPHLHGARRRAHPARRRSPAVRARAAAARARRRPAGRDRDRVHGGAQRHARRRDARVRARAVGARGSGDRAQHPVSRVGARAPQARADVRRRTRRARAPRISPRASRGSSRSRSGCCTASGSRAR